MGLVWGIAELEIGDPGLSFVIRGLVMEKI
jgi:hypothetical protein